MTSSRAQHLVAGILRGLLSLTLLACGGAASTAGQESSATPIVAYGSTVDQWITTQEAAMTPIATAAVATFVLPPVTGDVAATSDAGAAAAPLASGAATIAATSDTVATDTVVTDTSTPPTSYTDETTDTIYHVLEWENLVPAEFQAEAIMARYQDQLVGFQDGDPGAMEVYEQMQQEFANAPVNEELDNTFIRLPGFIAPLDYTDGVITEFLLVPYFGACIHVPPPPANQTILVRVAEGHGIQSEDSYEPIWVQGLLTTEGTTTELATAGYYIHEATIQLYTE